MDTSQKQTWTTNEMLYLLGPRDKESVTWDEETLTKFAHAAGLKTEEDVEEPSRDEEFIFTSEGSDIGYIWDEVSTQPLMWRPALLECDVEPNYEGQRIQLARKLLDAAGINMPDIEVHLPEGVVDVAPLWPFFDTHYEAWDKVRFVHLSALDELFGPALSTLNQILIQAAVWSHKHAS